MITKPRKMRPFILRHTAALPMLLILGMMSSCLDNRDMSEITPIAYVSFYHGAMQSEELSISVDNNSYPRYYYPFKFGTYIDYGNFYTGDREFSFRNSGASNSLLDTLITLKASQTYSVFLADEGDLFLPIVVEDKLTNPGGSKAHIRLAHLSPDTSEVNLVMGNEETALFESSSFQQVTDYKAVDSGAAVLELKDALSGETLVTTTEIAIQPGRIYTMVIRGYQNSDSETSSSLGIQVIRNYPNY